jgi:uncharacterized protein involved in exopolysaccharide biosynthesis
MQKNNSVRSTGRHRSKDEISLRDLVMPLFRRKKMLVLTFLLTFGVAIALGILLPPSYKSQMSVLVNRERLDNPVSTEATTEMITTANSVTEEDINSEVELLKSRDTLEQVVLANGLAESHGFSLADLLHPYQTKADRVARAVNGLAKKLKIEAGLKTDIINISYSSADAGLSYRVLRTLADLYIAKHVAVHHAPGSYDFFNIETERYKKALDGSEARLRDFGKEQSIAAPDLIRTDLALQLTNAIGQLHTTEESIAADEQRIGSDQQQMVITPQRSATQQATNPADKLLQDLNDALLVAQTKRTQLVLKYDANYPLVKEADQEIAQDRAAIAAAERTRYVTETTDRDPTFELLREDLAKTRSDLASQRAALTKSQQSIKTMQNQMVDLDQKSLTQQDLLREAKANEDNYLLYLSKREQARTSDALDRTRIANVAIAMPPFIPALPTYSMTLIAFVAFVFSIVLSIASTYTADYLDSSFHSPAEVIDILDIPVVISMPKRTA